LIDIAGHIVHIDFGFMLSNSPGSLNWESAPFKLTDELVMVMDGAGSNVFHYFKALCIRGFMEVRKYSEKITLLVEMMLNGTTFSTTLSFFFPFVKCLTRPRRSQNAVLRGYATNGGRAQRAIRTRVD